MKIIATDNLNREEVADRLILSFPNREDHIQKAQEFCDWINSFSCNDYGGIFYKIVPMDYKLSRGMADLV